MQSKPVKATVVSMEDEARSAPNTPGKSKSRRKDEVTSTPSNTSPTKSNISKENSVIGYVHMLSSPISNKRKTMKYSSLILQTEDKEVDVLLYSPTKRALLSDSERTRTPVKIRKYTYTSDHEMAIEDILTEENNESTLVVPFIKSVEKVEVYSVCLQCSKKLLQATASLIVKCDRCKHSMILSNCQKRISVHFTVESQDVTTLTVFENILRSVIPEMGEISEEELIERLLLLNNVRITYNSVTLIVSYI